MRRLLKPVVDLREGETWTAVLMFAYSFLAMTAWNIIKPATRSTFISGLGAENLPWVQLAAGVFVGVIMQGYSGAIGYVPRRWAIPVTQAGSAVILLALWGPLAAQYEWASVVFYLLGLILGILLISQFWTLANDVYDARQAKRLFGFIGGGASLGGATGAAITTFLVGRLGTANMVPVGAAVMLLCVGVLVLIMRRERAAGASGAGTEEEALGGGEAIRMLRESRHLQVIAIVIGCAALGAAIIEQQLNMAAEARLGQEQTDTITAFLARVTVFLSLAGFAIQVGLTSRIHRVLGIGFALMILPVSLGATAIVMLFNASLWAPAAARILDTSLRYTVDKTSREVLFLPLPPALKYKAKPFVDVTVDRFARASGALLMLVLIQPWGLNLDWQRLSLASLTLMAVWIGMVVRARRAYQAAFLRSLEQQAVMPEEIRTTEAGPRTIEMLVEELAHPDERRVLYAIDLLESFEKRHLITPLLLHHDSPAVRARTLRALQALRPDLARKWVPAVHKLLSDEDEDVRAGAISAMAAIEGREVAGLLRRALDDPNPRIAVTAAVALGASGVPEDSAVAIALLTRLGQDPRDSSAGTRRLVARALGQVPDPRARQLLVPLMHDTNLEVAREALHSAGRSGYSALYVPALVLLLRNPRLKADARAVLVGYGDAVVEPLAYFLNDQNEDPRVRRHLPATLGKIPLRASIAALVDALDDPDPYLRFKAVVELDQLHRRRPDLPIPRGSIEASVLAEARRFANALTLYHNLFTSELFDRGSLVGRALAETQERSQKMVFWLLGLIYPFRDIHAARHAIDRGDARGRAAAVEYLDNLLAGELRRRVMPLIEDLPPDERVSRANRIYRSRRRDPEETLAQLVHDEDQVVAASAIHLVAERSFWSLADDVAHVREHRTGRDGYAAEAASWALAAGPRDPAGRPQRGRELLPAVAVADRLRHFPHFRYMSVNELFRIAATEGQVRYGRNRVIVPGGVPPDAVQLVLDGDLLVETAGEPVVRHAPTVLALEEMLGSIPMQTTVRAAGSVIALAITREEFFALVSHNVELARGLFRAFLEEHPNAVWPLASRGSIPEGLLRAGDADLDPMERALLLESLPQLRGATSEQLWRLTAIARDVRLTAGSVLFGEADTPAVYVLLSGMLQVETPGRPAFAFDEGDVVGFYETLGGVPMKARVTVTESGRALRIDGGELFDLLGDDIDLLQGLFMSLLRGSGGARDTAAAS